MATWYTAASVGVSDEVNDLWPDAAQLGDGTIELLFDIAREQVLTYAPALAVGAPIPARYALAQLRQAVNLYRAATVDAGGQIGDPDGGFVITPRPLDWHIKSLLRPAKGRPRVR